jgi:hypothetical protein
MSKKSVLEGVKSLPIFCLNCYHHSWKNCYGDNPCTPVRLAKMFPEAKINLAIQELYFKVPFEEHEKWNNNRRKKLKSSVMLKETKEKE